MHKKVVASIVVVLVLVIFVTRKARDRLGSPSLSEGDSVGCNDGTGMVYRYTQGQLRYYPSPPIASSWNPRWFDIKTLTAEECQRIPKGDPMPMNASPPDQSIQTDDLDRTFFGKTVAIQGPRDNHKRFCGVRSRESPVVECQSLDVTDAHLFDVEKTGACSARRDGKTECQFALKNKLTGQYCADEGNQFICNRPAVGPWEKHALIKQPGRRVFSFPGGKSGKDRKACVEKPNGGIVCDGGDAITAFPDFYDWRAMFRWILPGELPSGISQGSPEIKDDPYSTFFGKMVAITGPASDHKTYCGVKTLADPVLTCEDTKVYDNHLFEINKTQDCKPRPLGGQECQFSFKNKLTGGYCADEGNRIICNRDKVGDWEKYALIKTPGIREFSFPGAKSGKERKACSDKTGGGVVCQGGSDAYGKHETFRWRLASEIPDAIPGDIRPPPPPTDGEIQPSSSTMPSPASNTPPMVDELNRTFFGKTVVITGPGSDHKTYCGVKSLDDPSVECADTEVFDNHQFEIVRTQECAPRREGGFECQFALKNKLTGKFCADEGNRIVCDRDAIGNQEKHAFIKHPQPREFSFPGGKSGKARKACMDKYNDIVCDGGKDDYSGKNTRFRYKLLSEISNVQKGDNNPPPQDEGADGVDMETSADMETDSATLTALQTPLIIAGSVIAGLVVLRMIMPSSSAARPAFYPQYPPMYPQMYPQM